MANKKSLDQTRSFHTFLLLVIAMNILVFYLIDSKIIPRDSEFFLRITISRTIAVTMACLALGFSIWKGEDLRRKEIILWGFAIFVPILINAWIIQTSYISLGEYPLFFGFQKLCYIIFFILPIGAIWVNLVMLLLMTLEGVLFWALYSPQLYDTLISRGEPWFTICFAVAGFICFIFNYIYAARAKELTEARLHAGVYRKMASIAVSVNDQMNTPLQTIQNSLEYLEQSPTDVSLALDRIKPAFERIKKITSTFKQFDGAFNWEKSDLMDEKELLKEFKKQAALIRPRND